ncbi:GerMN domain-containing protein [Paenibacillus sp. NEAU-GSW1]|uniref:GerMN domain-containing protein n=1 Tax=Paenibacillus sp. NEAU-GSW1 TaxID=2682486 RepID=UPI0012E2533C|nr:GerMN domain-containing protein [Paenibacillus sp. NEAU-GSW1]MUT65419.1 hypothetical protein [Paenibacillus sp. NEAU-GSW1]
MRKPTNLAVMLLLVTIVASACGNQSTTKNGSDQAASPSASPIVSTEASPSVSPEATPEPTPEQSEAPAKRNSTISVYYADKEFSSSVQKQVEVAYGSDQELVQQAVGALQIEQDGEIQSPWKLIEIRKTELNDGAVTIDIHLPDEARLGAPGEALVLETLEKTLFQFDFVKSYDLLVEGEPAESLMGHLELEHPKQRQAAQ